MRDRPARPDDRPPKDRRLRTALVLAGLGLLVAGIAIALVGGVLGPDEEPEIDREHPDADTDQSAPGTTDADGEAAAGNADGDSDDAGPAQNNSNDSTDGDDDTSPEDPSGRDDTPGEGDPPDHADGTGPPEVPPGQQAGNENGDGNEGRP